MTSLFIIALSIVTAFVAGGFFAVKRARKTAVKYGCPFKQACLEYNETETRLAVKRVLTLMVNSNVPKKEIRKLVDSSL